MGSHRVGHDWSDLAAAAAAAAAAAEQLNDDEVTSDVFDFMLLWTIARQAPLSIEFSRQEYLSGLPALL